jgi:predicted DNA-binding transcriptional regulator AlpA
MRGWSGSSDFSLRDSSPEMKAPTILKTRTPIRLVEIAELLGVSKQRAHQLADEPGFPAPVERDGRGRLWDRREIQLWARAWRKAQPRR